MSESPNPDQTSSDRLKAQEDLMQLSSAQLDGSLSVSEEAQWRQASGGIIPGDVVDSFSRDSRRLGEIMRSLPIRSAGDQILNAVAAARQLDQVHPSQNGWTEKITVRRLLFGTSAVMTAAMLLLLVRYQPTSEFEAVATSEAIPRITGNQRSAMEPSPTVFPETEVLSAGDDWQILTLRISASDREEALSQVRMLASSVGLTMQPMSDSMSKGDLDGFGILLTSAPAERQAFLDQVTNSKLIHSSEWDPSQIAKMDRQSLISAVRESMLSPTQSELHFGEVFIAVHSNGTVEEPMVADRGGEDLSIRENLSSNFALRSDVVDSDLNTSKPQSTETGMDSVLQKSAAPGRINSALRNRPVLVMFELEQIPSARSRGL